MEKNLGALSDGARVVIIGGGPGGVACALALQRLATQTGRGVQITLLESKQFSDERHYNQCTGVLAPPLPTLLEERLGLRFPRHLSRGQVPGYVLHTAGEQTVLAGDEQPSVALRRVQFDAYMLAAAEERGIAVLATRAVDLEFHADRVMVYTDSVPLEAEVVVGAFGLDEGSAALFARLTSYRPPRALSSVVTKYHPGTEGMAAFGAYIHAFLLRHPRIEFGAVTPKGNHLTVNIAGRSVDTPLMQTFLDHPAVRAVLPNLESAGQYDPNDMRFFKGRFPSSLARHYYGDRYVMVGDAAGLVRAFKGKGVTSAVLTGIRAAETILQAGISERAFQHRYAAANQDIVQDLPYGQGMRIVTILLSRFGLLDPLLRAARRDPGVRSALFEAVSAHAPYRQVLTHVLRPGALLSILRALL